MVDTLIAASSRLAASDALGNERNASCLKRHGACEQRLTRLKQIEVRDSPRQVTDPWFAHAFQVAHRREYVRLHTARHECRGYQQCPVTVEWLLLRAHERYAETLGTADHARDTFAKHVCPSDPFILDLPVLVTHWIVRTPAELAPEVGVADAAFLEGVVEQSSRLKCQKRLYGVQRTSATAVTPCFDNSARNRSNG